MPVSIGEIIEKRYRIDRKLGQGGFGAVYYALDLRLNVACAIKECLDTSDAATRQFKREASMLAELRHPNLPRVTDYFDLQAKGLYLVINFIEGEDLATRINELPWRFTEEQVLPWIKQVCEALDYLHSHTPPIIHRDIKPQNIIVTKDNAAVLVDFGLAKVYDPSKQTTTGARGGTPGFSPLEQYGQGTTDQRSDIYSLGATIYALLTGTIPPESIERVVTNVSLKPMHVFNPTISSSFDNAISKALEINPDRRIQTVKELFKALSDHNSAIISSNQNYSQTIAGIHSSIPDGFQLDQKDYKLQQATVWFEKGISLRSQRHYEEAITCFDEAQKINRIWQLPGPKKADA